MAGGKAAAPYSSQLLLTPHEPQHVRWNSGLGSFFAQISSASFLPLVSRQSTSRVCDISHVLVPHVTPVAFLMQSDHPSGPITQLATGSSEMVPNEKMSHPAAVSVLGRAGSSHWTSSQIWAGEL